MLEDVKSSIESDKVSISSPSSEGGGQQKLAFQGLHPYCFH